MVHRSVATADARLEVDCTSRQPARTDQKPRRVLCRHHFDLLVTEDSMGQSPAIQATAGERRLIAGKIWSGGNDWQFVSLFAAPTDHIFVVFRGQAYSAQPTSLTTVSEGWSRFLLGIG